MYSIILKLKSNCDCGCGCKIDNTKPSSPKERWKYLTNADGSIYQEEDLEKVRLKCIELLSDNLLSSIKVVQNKAAIAYVQIEGAPDPHVSTLPTVTDADNGKVLMVIEGEWGVSEVEVLPNVTLSDNGKILKVVNGVWTAVEDGSSGGSTVTITPTLAEGVKIADYNIDGVDGVLYTPDVFGSATTSAAGTKGLVPAPPILENNHNIYFLKSNGSWGLDVQYKDTTWKDTGVPVNFYTDGDGEIVFVDEWWTPKEEYELQIDKKELHAKLDQNNNYQTERYLSPDSMEVHFDYDNFLRIKASTDDEWTKKQIHMDTDDDESEITVYPTDIKLSTTWDGTHELLKDAIAAAASSGGGTTVVANPSETATVELNKLKVDNTVYEIPNEIPNDFKVNLECQYGTGTNIFTSGSSYANSDTYILVPKSAFDSPLDILTNLRIFMLQQENPGEEGVIVVGGPQTMWYETYRGIMGDQISSKLFMTLIRGNNEKIIAQVVKAGEIATYTMQLNDYVKQNYWCIGKIQTYELTSTVITAQQVDDMWDSVFNE